MSDLTIPAVHAGTPNRASHADRAAGASRPAPRRPTQLAAFDLGSDLRSGDVDAVLREFQNILLHEMVKAMRDATPKENLFGDNTGREMFESFLDQEYVRVMGERMGSLGLTEALKEQLRLNPAPAAGRPPARNAGASRPIQ
jgi:Rod binding domain-containing protein